MNSYKIDLFMLAVTVFTVTVNFVQHT